MDINASLIVQLFVFIVFIGLTMKFLWPPIIKALEMRRKNIENGLFAAKKGYKELKLAKIKAKEELIEAKAQAAQIIEKANQRANHIIESAKNKAHEEGMQFLKLAKSNIKQEYNTAKIELIQQVSDIAIAGAQKILQREVNKSNNDHLVDELVSEI